MQYLNAHLRSSIRRVQLIFIITFIYSIPVHSQATWQVLDMPEYSIRFPNSWTAVDLDTITGVHADISLLGPPHVEFRSNIMMLTEDLSGEHWELSEYMQANMADARETYTSFKIIASSVNRPRAMYIATFVVSQFEVRTINYFWIKKNKAYILTYASVVAESDEMTMQARQIMDSFAFK